MTHYDIPTHTTPQLPSCIKTTRQQTTPSRLVVRLIIPIQSMTLDLRARRPKHPVKRQFHVLQQMARDLDMPHIRRMVQRPDIVVLQNSRGVEVVHVARVGEVAVHVLDFREETRALRVGVSHGGEAGPERLWRG